MTISNIANDVDEAAKVNRAQIEHRATWMALFYDEMTRADVDAGQIMRRAIRRCGKAAGANLKKQCGNPDDLTDFRAHFLTELVTTTFNVQDVTCNNDSLAIDFHYCALVTAWQKLGIDEKTIKLLCDIAMEGDRGIAEAMGYKLTLTDTIAAGCPQCKLQFHVHP